MQVRAIYDYQAQGADELNLQAGQVFELTSGANGGVNFGDGWWEGKSTLANSVGASCAAVGLSPQGKSGIFPSNYVSQNDVVSPVLTWY